MMIIKISGIIIYRFKKIKLLNHLVPIILKKTTAIIKILTGTNITISKILKHPSNYKSNKVN